MPANYRRFLPLILVAIFALFILPNLFKKKSHSSSHKCTPAMAAYCTSAHLVGLDLSHEDLTKANFAHADLAGADLHAATLTSANFTGAFLSGADLSGAVLARARFSGANLTGRISPVQQRPT